MVHRLKFDACRDIRNAVKDIYTKFDDGPGESVDFKVSPTFRPLLKRQRSQDLEQDSLPDTEDSKVKQVSDLRVPTPKEENDAPALQNLDYELEEIM